MSQWFSSRKAEWAGFTLFLSLALTLFFVWPLSGYISRWSEMALCSLCIFGCGWCSLWKPSDSKKLLGVVLMAAGFAVLPYLIFLSAQPVDDKRLFSELAATGAAGWVLIAIQLHLGERARSLYQTMSDNRKTPSSQDIQP